MPCTVSTVRSLYGVRITSSNVRDGTQLAWGYLGGDPEGFPLDLDAEFGRRPQAGPRDALGNRSCSHFHYSGSASRIPSRYVIESRTYASNTQIEAKVRDKVTKLLGCTMTGSVKAYKTAPTFRGSELVWNIPAGSDQWPGLWPAYQLVKGRVRAVCRDGGFISAQADLTLTARRDDVKPKTLTASGSGGAKGSFNFDAVGDYTDAGRSTKLRFTISVSRTGKMSIAKEDPHIAFNEARGVLPTIFKEAVLVLSHDKFAESAMPDAAVSGFNHLQEVTINSLAYTRDLTHLVSDAKRLRKALKKVRNPSAWPDFWLNYRFGFRLFYEDTKEILTAAKRYKKNTFKGKIRRTHSRSSGSDTTPFGDGVSHKYGLTIYSREQPLTERGILHAASSLDALPSLSNMWDFVPYSFVVDWIVPVGDYLERLDTSVAAWVYPIQSAVETVKSEMELALPPNWGGSLTYVYFTRGILSQADLSRRVAQLPTRMLSGLSLKHGIDTLCLAVQRFR